MTGKNLIVACTASGIAASPFCAYRTYRPVSHAVGSFDEWLVSAAIGGDGFPTLRTAIIAGACFGFLVGLLLMQLMGPSSRKNDMEPPILRTPTAAAFLALVAVIAILFISYNHTLQMLNTIVWPDYLSMWVIVIVISAFGSSILMGLLNEFERIFEKSTFSIKMGILCCWPIALFAGTVLMAGVMGCGLLAGFAIGRTYGCPIATGWMGMCFAVIAAAFSENIFWPIYFPTPKTGPTKETGKKQASSAP
jgi:hypothetical protein